MQQVISLGFKPRTWQAEVFRAILRFTILVVHRRGGKTLLAILRLVDAALRFTGGRGEFAYIAPELKQAKGIAWDYLKSYACKVPYTQVNEAELWVRFPNGARIRLYGADNPNSLRGYYFDGVVLDEVAQMKPEIWGEILVPALADRKGWALFIGTPHGINLFSELFFAAEAAGWCAKKFTVYDTDVFTPQEIDEFKKSMTERQFRQEMLCDFQAANDDALIPIDAAIAAEQRVILEQQISFAPKILGVDVAWNGGDRCVIFPRQGLCSFKPTVIPGLAEKSFSARVANVIERWGADMTFVDNTGGYGGEVVSRLKDAGYMVRPVVVSEKPVQPRFLNLRAEMWFKMAEWIKDGALPQVEGLRDELCAPCFDNNNAAAKFQLEAKDEIKKKIGRSPDIADALALTFAYPVAKREAMPIIGETYGRAKTEWDPVGGGRDE